MKLTRSLWVLGACIVLGCSADTSKGGGHGGGSNGNAGAGGDGFGNSGSAGDGLGSGTGNGGTGSGSAGAAGGLSDGSCTATGAEAMVGKQGADIVWVVDNSCSMATEAAAVQTNMNTFAKSLSDKGIDVHLVLISSGNASGMTMACPMDNNYLTCLLNQVASSASFGICIQAPFGSGMCPDDSKAPNYLHVPNNVGSWDALVQIINAYPMYKDMMRPGAAKHFVVVSDDNSTQMTADMFTQSVNALDPVLFKDWHFSGVYAKTMCADASSIGTVYDTLVQQTGGTFGDLCMQQFEPVFTELAKNVEMKAEIACDWPIPPPPAGQTLDPNKVNVRFTTPDGTAVDLGKVPAGEDCGDREGWIYDSETAPTKVISCPKSCERFRASGGKVDVLFGCASVPVE